MKYLTFLLLTVAMFFTSCNYKNPKREVIVNQSIETIQDSSFFDLSKTYPSDKFLFDTVRIVSLHELKGSSLYKLHCKMCHGDYGQGDGVKARLQEGICPHDLSTEDKPDEVVYYIILNGGTRMPPGQEKLSNGEVKVLVLYIKKFKN